MFAVFSVPVLYIFVSHIDTPQKGKVKDKLHKLAKEDEQVPNAVRLIEIDFHTRLALLYSSIVRGRKSRQKLSSLGNKTSTVLILQPQNLSLTF